MHDAKTKQNALKMIITNSVFTALVKNCCIVGILIGVGRIVPDMPLVGAFTLFLICALLIFLVNFYFDILAKTVNSLTYTSRGWVSKILNMRNLLIIVSFCLAIFSAFSLVMQIPGLDNLGLLIIGLTAPIFTLMNVFINWLLKDESVPWFLTGRCLRVSIWITSVIIILLYAICLYNYSITPVYDTLEAVKNAQPRPWANSTSAFLREAGEWSALLGSYRDYGLAILNVGQYPHIIISLSTYFAIFLGVCSILSFFSIPRTELRRLIVPLTPGSELPKASSMAIIFCTIIFVIGVAIFINIAQFMEHQAINNSKLPQSRLHIENFVDKTIIAGNKIYKSQMLPLLDTVRSKYEDKVKQRLISLHNESIEKIKHYYTVNFATMERNVDSYLDWYYSLTAEYMRIANLMTGTIEEYMQAELRKHLESGLEKDADFSISEEKILKIVNEYNIKMQQEMQQILSENELFSIPEQKSENLKKISLDTLLAPLQYSSQFSSFTKRWDRARLSGGIAGVGLMSGMIAGKVASKTVFKLAAKALAKVATGKITSMAAFAAAGAAFGSIIPGPGTAAGAAIGAAIGAVVTVVVDAGLLTAEEAFSREEMKQEILNEIAELKRTTLDNLEKNDATSPGVR